jgi:hypothetical protein
MPTHPQVQETTERFFTMVKSLDTFDRIEVRAVVDTLLSPSRREQCFIGTYRRIVANIATLQELRSAKHFQAVAMIARALFELAVDIRLVDIVPESCLKMTEFIDVEKLRCARRILRFKADHPEVNVDTSISEAFVANNQSRVNTAKEALWPKSKRVEHWSGIRLSDRVKLSGSPFEEIYALHYPYLSWQVHSGLTGIVNLKADTFTLLCASGFRLAADSYWETLSAMIREFKLEKVNEKIRGKMKAAKLLPFTDTPEQAEQLLAALTARA